MSAPMVGLVFFLVWAIFAVPTLLILLRIYNRTRMGSILWLIGALVAWPVVTKVLQMYLPFVMAMSHMASGQGPGLSFFLIQSLVQVVIGSTLLLTALVLLDRDLAARMDPTPPPPQ